MEKDPLLAEAFSSRLDRVILADGTQPQATDACRASTFKLAVIGIGTSVEASVLTAGNLVVDVNYNVWGTVHLILGVLLLLSGAGVLTGNLAARIVGVILAGLSALANLVFIEAYPFWSIIIITVDVLVIYALTVHGRELKDSV